MPKQVRHDAKYVIYLSNWYNYPEAVKDFDEDISLQSKEDTSEMIHFNLLLYAAIVYEKINEHENAKDFLNEGYSMNEDNLYYAYYPYQITTYEINEAMKDE